MFIFLLIVLYYPSNTFYKKVESFSDHIKWNSLEYLENFYYFGGKMMFFFIGAILDLTGVSIELIIRVVVFSILILATFTRLIYEYHKNNLSEEVFQGSIYLYAMLSNVCFIDIPLVS